MKVFFLSLGCDKNRVDSEKMLGMLGASGFSFCDDEHEADVIVINTCCFIDSAKEESIDAILEMAKMKDDGVCKRLVVTGCMSERYKAEILKELPEVDAIVGINELADIIKASDPDHVTDGKKITPDHKRIITTPGHFEYIKIADGCDKRCTYCAIPNIRGHYKSIAYEEVLNDAENMAAAGVKELILVAQETTLYGTDLYHENRLPSLLRELCKIEGINWIRLMYAYPEDVDEELLKTISEEKKIVHYLDIPVQHSSDKILKRMGRRTSRAELEKKIELIRTIIPDITLRTTLITGFPGETCKDHDDVIDFIKKIRFDHLGVFKYSREDGTPAAAFSNQVSERVKDRRYDEIMKVQNVISHEKLKEKIGKVFDIMVEGYLPEDDIYVGRTYMDAPDIDGFFYIASRRELMTGDIITAKCTDAGDYDLYGEILE